MQLVSRDRRGRRVASQWMIERADKGPPAAAQGCSWLGVPRKAPGHREWIARVVGAQHGGEGIIEQRAGTAERWRGDHRQRAGAESVCIRQSTGARGVAEQRNGLAQKAPIKRDLAGTVTDANNEISRVGAQRGGTGHCAACRHSCTVARGPSAARRCGEAQRQQRGYACSRRRQR